MAWTVRSVGTSPGADGTTDCVITKPANLAAGDLMIAHLITYAASTINDDLGWNLIRSDEYPSGRVTQHWYWKIADAADAAAATFTFTYVDSEAGVLGKIIAISDGFNAADPIDQDNAQSQDSDVVTAPTITPTNANSLILLAGAVRDDHTHTGYAIATDDPGGWTEAYDDLYNGAADTSQACAYAERAQTSATGNGTFSTTNAEYNWGTLISLNPTPAGGLSIPVAMHHYTKNIRAG